MKTADQKWQLASKVALVVLNFFLLMQFVSMYQTEYQLVTPLVPKNVLWEINRQYAFVAFVLTGVNIVSLLLFFWKKHMAVVIVIAIALAASRYIYL
jgi:hypothetical protein